MRTDICIIGGGSAGVGAAYRALASCTRAVSVVVVERDQTLGGTSTNGGVNNWEPGIGGPGLHLELARALSPLDAGVGRSSHFYAPDEPYGLSDIDRSAPYEASLRRAGLPPARTARFHFEPDAMARAMEDAIYGAARGHAVALRYSTSFLDAKTGHGRIDSIRVYDARAHAVETIEAKVFIDASADIVLARSCGCAVAFGEEAAGTYGEPSAPEAASGSVNGVSFIFRARAEGPGAPPSSTDPPAWTLATDAAAWASARRSAAIVRYPNGDLNVNCLPTMDGAEFFSLADHERTRIGRARTYHLWHKYRSSYGFGAWRLLSFAPGIGVRESWRLVGRSVLREQDVRAGYRAQPLRDRIVAYGDHALDIHGARNVTYQSVSELREPYGIPFDCMVPVEVDNLLVACRGASFSHIAASSCRLSRTMMALGEAAGTAAALAVVSGARASEIDPALVRASLGLPRFEEEVAALWDSGLRPI